MRSFIRKFLLVGIPFGIWVGFVYGPEDELSSAIWLGIKAGALAGLAAVVIARYRQNRVSESAPVLGGDEVLIRKARAEYKFAPGWLYLTDRRLLFEGYPADENSAEVTRLFDDQPIDEKVGYVSIAVSEVVEAAVSRHPATSQLEVVFSSGRKEYFLTENLDMWVEDISDVRQRYLDGPRSEDLHLFNS